MDIIELKEKDGISENVKLNKIYLRFLDLLNELRKKELPIKITEIINQDVNELNSTSVEEKRLKNLFKKKQEKIIQLLEKELKIVPKNYYCILRRKRASSPAKENQESG